MGERGGLGQEWIELDWLKEKRYYGIQEFMANRLEVALRLSWLNCCSNGKKKGVRLKEKASAAGVAANAYWSKKGCVDWWEKLDASTRKNVFWVILGKSAKSLVYLGTFLFWLLLFDALNLTDSLILELLS